MSARPGSGRLSRHTCHVGPILLLLAAAALLAAAPAARALDAPNGTHRWGIWRGGDKVGEDVTTFRHENGLLIVEIRISIAPRFLGIVVERYKHVEEEIWKAGKLIALDARTNRYGKKASLKVRATAEGLAVDGSAGSFVLLTSLYPSSLWNVAMTRTDQLLDVVSGQVVPVHFTEGAEEPIQIDGHDVRARHVTVSGGLARELWYGPDGVLARLQYQDPDGALLDFRAEPRK
jgi:Domain of unknown function (DUF6134)